ncbi:hypothetical protein Sgou_32640 [Streptomyces gougerotii]|uniref:Uncharacterized protein n=1 Tax=Streptomyces gougerotii TaxID=53448 RepID=A0ABQ1D7Y6_9ACTN|nr:hypothetical protein Sgou_32640 [Streptomyces gougerotii]
MVAQEEEPPGGDDHVERDRGGSVAGREVGLVDDGAVDGQTAPCVAADDAVTAGPHDPLDEVALTEVLGAVEDDHVPAARLVSETVGQLVDQDPVTDAQLRLHRPARDLERLEDEGAEQQDEDHTDGKPRGEPASREPGRTRGARPLLRPGFLRDVPWSGGGGAVALLVLCFGVHRCQMLSGSASDTNRQAALDLFVGPAPARLSAPGPSPGGFSCRASP